jgi:hypothetical protein
MMRRFALALGLLGWIGGAALAQEKITAAPTPAKQEAHAPAHGQIVYEPGCMDCCQSHGGGGLTAGVGFYYVQPHWESNAAFYTSTAVDGFLVRAQEDFSYDYDFSPRASVAFTNCDGSGFRARYWYFEDDASTSAADGPLTTLQSASPMDLSILAPQNGTLNTTSDLRLNVWDFEGTYDWKPDCWRVTFFGGIRYVHLSQSYEANAVDATGAVVQVLTSGHNFNVWGPTGGIETRRPLGGMGLELYGSSRASILFGDGQQTTGVATLDAAGNAVNGAVGTSSRDDILPVLEAELGAEWSHECCSGMRAFVNVALVGQVWFGAGNAARASTPDVLGPLAGGVEDESNLGFFGITVIGGIAY